MLAGPRILVIACLFALAPISAKTALSEGGPPLITEDTGTPGAGIRQLNAAYTMSSAPSQKSYQVPSLEFNYGYGDTAQFTIRGSALINDQEGDTHSGAGNTSGGVKWRYYEDPSGFYSLSTFPQIEINTPPGNPRRGVVRSGTNFLVPAQLGFHLFEHLYLWTDAGYQVVQHHRDQLLTGVAIDGAASADADLIAELRAATDEALENTDVLFNLGGRLALTQHLSFNMSAGRSFRSGSQNPRLILYSGITWSFDP